MLSALCTSVIADSSELDQISLSRILNNSLESNTSLCASNFGELVEVLNERCQPALIVVELKLPGLDGVHGIKRLQAMRPTARVTIADRGFERSDVLASLAAGAHGFVCKNLSVCQLSAAFARVMEGHIYVPDEIAEVSIEGPDPANDDIVSRPSLTARQIAVLQLLARDESNKQIGRDLGISDSTVKVHLASAFRQLGVRNRVAAAKAISSWM